MSWPSPSGGPVEPPQFRPRRRGMTGLGIVLILLSFVLGALGIGEFFLTAARPLAKTFSTPSQPTPVNTYLSLTKGQYAVFERTGQSSPDDPSGSKSAGSGGTLEPTIRPDEVTVMGPNGQTVPVTGSSSAAGTISRNQEIYTVAAKFTASTDGSYRVRVLTPKQKEVIIGPSLTSGFVRGWPWLLGCVAGVIVFIIGVVLIIVARARRIPASWRAGGFGGGGSGFGGSGFSGGGYQQPMTAPPGWYTDPAAAGRMRYWDGHGWNTDAR